MKDRIVALRAIPLIDLTDLSDDCTDTRVSAMISRARSLPIPVAAICIWPRFVVQARKELGACKIRLATVVNFPTGAQDVESVCAETRQALAEGADEIDLVLPWRALLDGLDEVAREMVRAVRQCLTPDALLKVIIESGELPDADAIRRASMLAIEEGAHFIKTSTGKTKISASPEAARIMLECILGSGKDVGFKAAGGLRTLAQARAYLELADSIMGEGWTSPRHFRFGASGLLDPLLAAL